MYPHPPTHSLAHLPIVSLLCAALCTLSACRSPEGDSQWLKRLKDPAKREAAVSHFRKIRRQAISPAQKARISAAVVPALCALYRQYHEPGVLKHIVAFGDRSAIPTLVSVLTSPGSDAASVALVGRTLVDLRAMEAVEPLAQLVQRPPAARTERHVATLEAVKVLGKLGDRRAVPALVKALKASSAADDVRLCQASSRALSELADRRAVSALLGGLMTFARGQGDCLPRARVALARLGRPAVDALLGLLDEPTKMARLARANGLSAAAATARVASLLGDVMAREAAPQLRALAVDNEADLAVREAAVLALGKVSGEGGARPLIKLLKDGGAHRRLRLQACRALTLMGAKAALPALLDLADQGSLPRGDESLRYAAAEAYGLLVGAEVDAGYERVKEIWKKETRRLGRQVFRRVLDRQDLAVRCQDDPTRYAQIVADRNQTPVRRAKAVTMIATLSNGRKSLTQLTSALHVRDAGLRRRFLWAAMRVGKSTDAALVKTLRAIVKRDASRKARFLGGDMEGEGKIALAVILRKTK